MLASGIRNLRNSWGSRASSIKSWNSLPSLCSQQKLDISDGGPCTASKEICSWLRRAPSCRSEEKHSYSSLFKSPWNAGWHCSFASDTLKLRGTDFNGILSLENLESAVAEGDIDTVIVAFTDCYGRLLGKRYTGRFFLEHGAREGSHACNYLLATDMDMDPVQGYASANWQLGYGDFHLAPDLSTLRRCSWLDKTAMVLCDVHDMKQHKLVEHAPRTILQRQVQAAQEQGLAAMAATELEYFLYQDDYEAAKDKNYEGLKPLGWVREDYHILQGTREEFFNAAARRHLEESGIPVENSKGEWGLGQHELNIRYAGVMEMADRHVVYKQCLKELAIENGVAVTFMAKPHMEEPGSSCHIHLSLVRQADGRNMFVGDEWEPVQGFQGSRAFESFLGGWMKNTRELMPLFAPTVNSYKRFVSQSWAPTNITWSLDNRTSLFRVVGSGESLRIEFRLPGADCNPYLALAASLASGLDGLQRQVTPPRPLQGKSGYSLDKVRAASRVPTSLAEAVDLFHQSKFAKKFLGKEVHEHYSHFYSTEIRKFNMAVTDWERKRYFEQI